MSHLTTAWNAHFNNRQPEMPLLSRIVTWCLSDRNSGLNIIVNEDYLYSGNLWGQERHLDPEKMYHMIEADIDG